MTQLTVQQLIKHFETFENNFSYLRNRFYSNYETIEHLKDMKKDRVFNVQNAKSVSNCIIITD